MRALIPLLAAALLTACSPSVQKSEVAGMYVLEGKVEFFLDIQSNGTYVHTKIEKDGTKIVRTGRWEWDGTDSDNPMCLDGFQVFPGEGIGVSDTPSFFILHPEHSAQGVRFPVGDPDTPSHYFIRQTQE
jgi:hypothetical protein